MQVACFFLHCRVQQLLLGAAVEAPPSLPSRSSRARLGPKTLLLRKCSSETIFCAMSGSPTLSWPPPIAEATEAEEGCLASA